VAETIIPRGAFEQHLRTLAPHGDTNDIRIEERLDLAIATVMSRGDDRALAAKIHCEFGLPLPSTPRRGGSWAGCLARDSPGRRSLDGF
jgi:hypothetical protein